jgi:hypothetical protein
MANSDVYTLMFNLINDSYDNKDHLKDINLAFIENDFVVLPSFLKQDAFNILGKEISKLKGISKERKFVMPGYKTPRFLSTLGGTAILENSRFLNILYSHHELISLLSQIVGEQLYLCKHENEFMVFNYLNAKKSTHGWHLDDPTYAIIICFESPESEEDSRVEIIKKWTDYCRTNGRSPEDEVVDLVERARRENLVKTLPVLRPNDAYVLRTDRTLHRVTEIKTEGATRAILNLAYENTKNPHYGQTATLLYG